MKHRNALRIIALPLLLLAGAALLPGCGKGKKSVTLAGSTAFQPFAEKIAEKYMLVDTQINVTVQGGGSAVGVQSALSGAADIGMADLVELPPEASALKSVIVARDGIVVVVHPSNPVNDLTPEQIRGLFNGSVKNWKSVGGPDAPVTVVSREAGSGTRTSFEQILGGLALTEDAIIQDSNGTIRETVTNDPNALGYLSHGLLNEKIKGLTVAGESCTAEAISSGAYKLVRPIYFLFREPAAPELTAFIEFTLSRDSQSMLQASGLLPVN